MADDERATVEQQTHAWLEESFLRAMAALRESGETGFDEHGRPRQMSRTGFQEILRKLKIFRWLDGIEFSSFIDVGSGFDFVPDLVRHRYGVPAYFSDLVHSVNLPYSGESSGRLDHAVTINLTSLPFPDGAFDVVLASEVLEHLVRPVEAIAELLRITKKALVMTSLEALAPGRWARLLAHHLIDVRVPHVERNFFLLPEFLALFGSDLRHENLLHAATLPASPFLPDAEQQAIYAGFTDVDALVAALCRATSVGEHAGGGMGIVLVKAQPGVRVAAPRPEADAALARWLVAQTASAAHTGLEFLGRMTAGTIVFPARDRPIAASLRARLCCPDCRGGLGGTGTVLECTRCGSVFRGEYGVPILAPTRPVDPPQAETIRRLTGNNIARAHLVARLMRRLRRNERPPGALRQLGWSLARRLA